MFNDTIIRYSDVIMLHWYSWSSMLGKQVSYSEFILYSDHYHHHQNQNTGHFRSYSCSEFQWSRQLGTFFCWVTIASDIWWSFYLQSLYASKVEVQDYKLLCLADVEVRDQKFTLVGVLGSWWPIPHLPFWEAFSFVRNRIGSILVKTT